MIREFVAHVLAGLIFLALLGFVEVIIGPELTIVLGGAAVVGALLMTARRTAIDHALERGSTFPRPIGRSSRRGRRIDSEA